MNKNKNKTKNRNRNSDDLSCIFDTLDNVLFCPCICVYREYKKHNLRKSGHIVDPPLDYILNPSKYSTITNKMGITTYSKYGKTYSCYQDIPINIR